jgi:hypothetical protein
METSEPTNAGTGAVDPPLGDPWDRGKAPPIAPDARGADPLAGPDPAVGKVNRQQAYALTHPLDYAGGGLDLAPYRIVKRHATGLLLQAILAVDR